MPWTIHLGTPVVPETKHDVQRVIECAGERMSVQSHSGRGSRANERDARARLAVT